MQKTSLSFAILTSLLVIIFLMQSLTQLSTVEGNPIPYPDTPTTELPTLTVQTPEPSSPLYANNTLELNFTVVKPQSWNSYYHGMIPTVGIAQIFLFLDGVIKQAYPWTQNNVDQYTAVFTNLT